MTREEALNNLKEALEHSDIPMRDTLLESFYLLHPELAESEDEKIRKWLYDYIERVGRTWGKQPFHYEQILAWLEKQKVQKPAECIPDSIRFDEGFKTGREVGFREGVESVNPAEWSDEDENIRQALILLVSNDKKNGYTEFYKAQEITCDKVIAFLKKLKQLPTNEEMLRTLRAEYEKGIADTIAKYEQKAEWSEEDKDYYDTIVRKLEVIGDDSGLSDNQIKFLREHCPLNCSEWNEEDEKMRQSIIKDIEFDRNYTYATTGKVSEKYNEQINWLKILSLNRKKINEDVEKLCSNEWSEEDEDMFNDILLDMADRREMFKSNGETTFAENTQKKIDWLDSHHIQLKYQSSCSQPKQEWSEEDEKVINEACCVIDKYANSIQTLHLRRSVELFNLCEKLKSIRPPQDRYKDCPHRSDMFLLTQGFKSGKHELAIRFMNYLDENSPKEKMSLSNGECEDIDKAFKENDWAKIMRYYKKYSPSWKPSEEQMEHLQRAVNYYESDWGENKLLRILINDLKKRM